MMTTTATTLALMRCQSDRKIFRYFSFPLLLGPFF